MPTHSLVIEITDYETFPEWQAAVKKVDASRRSWSRGTTSRGDVKSIDGGFRFELSDQMMKRSVEDLKRRVENDS